MTFHPFTPLRVILDEVGDVLLWRSSIIIFRMINNKRKVILRFLPLSSSSKHFFVFNTSV